MASGQPENKLTVIVRYPTGEMRVHVHEVLTRTNTKIKECIGTFPVVYSNGRVGQKYEYKTFVDYPIRHCRELFKFMVRWLEQDVLEQVDQFIKDNGEKLYEEWTKQRELGGR